MRRGLIAVAGNAGDAIGQRMIAGSVFVFGTSGRHHGAGMRRGTLALLGDEPPEPLLPTFRLSGETPLQFMSLYLKHLSQQGFAVEKVRQGAAFHRFRGDLLEGGLGEILTARFPRS